MTPPRALVHDPMPARSRTGPPTDRWHRPGAARILMYHRLPRDTTARAELAVPLAQFEAQLAWLADHEVTILPLDEWLRRRHDPAARTARCAVITFDDGYGATTARAEATLARYSFPATLFLTTGLVGVRDPLDSTDEGVLTWPQLQGLRHLTVEAHTVTHPRLPHLGPAALRRELVETRGQIAEQLGRSPRHFAYPYGAYNRRVLRAVRAAGYASASAVHRGPSSPHDDRYRLHRLTVDGRDDLATFARQLRTGYATPRDALTSHLRDLLYALPTLHDALSRLRR